MTTSTVTAMASRDWAFLACRVLALYLLCFAIDTLLSFGIYRFIFPAANENAPWVRTYYILRFLLVFAGGVVLWFGASRLAPIIVPRQAGEPEDVGAGGWSVAQLLSLAVSVLGLVLLFVAIPEAARLGARYLVADRLGERDLVEIVFVAARLVVGIVLVFGSQGIANLITWARRWHTF